MFPIKQHNIYSDLNSVPLDHQKQFRLNKINEIKDYFIPEIKETKLMSKRLSKKNKSHNKIVMFARLKWNSMESKISETLINSEISHEDFMTTTDKEKRYWELERWIVKEVILKKY